jgi:hypothetical protein
MWPATAALTRPSSTGHRPAQASSRCTVPGAVPMIPAVSVAAAWAGVISSTSRDSPPRGTTPALRVVAIRRQDAPPSRNGSS